MQFRKGLILLVALLLLASLIVGCTPSAPATPGDDATPSEPEGNGEPTEQKLQGEGQGFNEDVPIKVEVTMVDGEITAIEILEHEETAGVSDPAFEQIPDAIIAAQSTDVDAVSGATKSSEGIKEAVANATGM